MVKHARLVFEEDISDNYPNGVCPDCGKTIPDDIIPGQDCTNCGHVFY